MRGLFHVSRSAALIGLLAAMALACQPRGPQTVELSIAEHTAVAELGQGYRIDSSAIQRIEADLENRLAMLDPHEGEVLGRLNRADRGEFVGAGPVVDTLSDLLSYSQTCFGAFDPTIQILWDLYEFDSGGRRATDEELADALKWVDYTELEMSGASILRRCEIVRTGLGPVMPAAVVDWLREALIREGIEASEVQVGHFMTVWGDESGDVVYEFNYPLDKATEDEDQLAMGSIRLRSGDCIAALDDDEAFFFAGGEQFHMVLHPITGKPVREIRAAVVVSEESCLQAAVFAYAVMVMGELRGLEFLDETQGVEGLLLTEDRELKVSGGLADRFWR